jgi:hypothetical protein
VTFGQVPESLPDVSPALRTAIVEATLPTVPGTFTNVGGGEQVLLAGAIVQSPRQLISR